MAEAGRFRWLTAMRSASIQTSMPHTGVCNDDGTPDNFKPRIQFKELFGLGLAYTIKK